MSECGEIRVTKKVLVPFTIKKFNDEIVLNVVPIYATHLFLGRPWQFERKAKHDGFRNRYTVEKDGKIYTLALLSPR